MCDCCAQEVIRQRLRAALPNSTPLIPPDLCGAFLSSAAFFFAPTRSQQSIRRSMALIGGPSPFALDRYAFAYSGLAEACRHLNSDTEPRVVQEPNGIPACSFDLRFNANSWMEISACRRDARSGQASTPRSQQP